MARMKLICNNKFKKIAEILEQGIKNYAVYCALIPLSLCVAVLLTVMIIAAARSYLVFGSNYFEYHAVGKILLGKINYEGARDPISIHPSE